MVKLVKESKDKFHYEVEYGGSRFNHGLKRLYSEDELRKFLESNKFDNHVSIKRIQEEDVTDMYKKYAEVVSSPKDCTDDEWNCLFDDGIVSKDM